MRTTTAQPDAWLREVLRDVAVRVTEGPYKDLWELRPDWRDAGVKGEVKVDGGDPEDAGEDGKEEEDWDEDDDEDDFEEIV